MSKLSENIIIIFISILLQWTSTVHHAECFRINFPSFPTSDTQKFILTGDSGLNKGALQVTFDVRGDPITNQSGRILYTKPLKLYKNKKIASFNSTFVLNIKPQTDGGGDGMAFILTKDPTVPTNSIGQWLGLVNSSSNGTSQSSIVAVEFDTKKSFLEDLDGNHVGFDVNSVYSEQQVSLNSTGIDLASGNDVAVMVIYDGVAKVMNVSVLNGNQTSKIGGGNSSSMILSRSVDLSQLLPSEVFVGFSASTGAGSELNCVKSWYFEGDDLDKQPLWFKILVSIMSLVVLVCVVGAGCLYWRAKVRQKQAKDDDLIGIETGLGPKKFKLKDLKVATSNFKPQNELGRGGFGVVYKGIWGTTEVAVKRIVNTPQGKQNLVAEVTTIGSLHHKNLVQLVGWCYESNELLLVYEYMPNGSLDTLLLDRDDVECLSWERRYSVICGVAQALDYLHHECSKRVLHRDIKPSNIMLDAEFNARLGDFGLARMFKLGEKTHHSTNELSGTPGYMAPEIFHMGRTTSETDVYAFGVLSLVVASGRTPWNNKNNNNNNGEEYQKYGTILVDWVWGLFRSNMIADAIDPRLKGSFDKEQAECMLVLGLACCHPNPYMRPSMRNALQVLMGEAAPPSIPLDKPAFMWPVSMPSIDELQLSFTEDDYDGDDDDKH